MIWGYPIYGPPILIPNIFSRYIPTITNRYIISLI
jgi:hypothetical protein